MDDRQAGRRVYRLTDDAYKGRRNGRRGKGRQK